jgi:hypothetical protein
MARATAQKTCFPFWKQEERKTVEKQHSEAVRKSLAAAALAAVVGAGGFCNSARGQVVINEIYADGGFASTATYLNDYIELYNAGTSSVSLSGYSLEYGGFSSAIGHTGTNVATFDILPLLPFNLASGAYYLIDMPSSASSTTHMFGPALSNSVTPNQYDTVYQPTFEPNFEGAKLALFDGSGRLQDYVGWGDDEAAGTWPAANDFQLGYGSPGGATDAATLALVAGSTIPQFSGTNVLTRQDVTGDNTADFTVADPDPMSSAPVPEPATIGILAVGSALMIARRRPRNVGTDTK